MALRVTPTSMFARAKFDLAASFARLARVQNQISSGKRIESVSDDVSTAARAMDVRRTLFATLESREAMASARSTADLQASLLQDVSALVIDARARAEEAAKGTNGPGELATIANDIDALLEQIVALGNQRVEGRYLFAGSHVNTVPFQFTRAKGSIASVTYHGDDVTREVQLGPSERKSIELSGMDAFLRFSRQATKVSTTTGLQSMVGAKDTMTGTAHVTLEHLQTVFGDGAVAGTGDSVSGLRPGTSAAGDTILGPAGAHTVTVVPAPGGGGTIQLDDGSAVAFTGAESDLTLTNANGDMVHVDVTAMTPGFGGVVALTGNGQARVDGGTPQALTFAAGQTFADSAGRVVHLDTTQVQRAGDALLTFGGTQSVFDALIELRDEIRGTNGFPKAGQVERIQARASVLDEVHQLLLTGVSDLGARSQSFERLESSLDLISVNLTARDADLTDTDLIAASIELSASSAAYEAALAAAAQLNRPTLLDYL